MSYWLEYFKIFRFLIQYFMLKFFKKLFLYLLIHIFIFVGLCSLIIFIFRIIEWDIGVDIVFQIFDELFNSVFGSWLMFFWWIVYIMGALSYEIVTDSYDYFTTRKFFNIVKIILGLFSILLLILYFLWITKLI